MLLMLVSFTKAIRKAKTLHLATELSALAPSFLTNQAAALSVQKTFSLLVLLSGVACLSLTSDDHDVLDKHFKSTLRRLMKLPDKTPDPVIYFLAGTPPIRVHIHYP